MIVRARTLLSLACVCLCGCGGKVSVDDSVALPDAGAGGAAAEAGADAGKDVGHDAITDSPPPADGGIPCGRTDDTFSMVATFKGQSYGCYAVGTGELSINLLVLPPDGEDHLSFDACPPNADCNAIPLAIVASAPGLHLNVPVGAFVHLELKVEYVGEACVAAMSIVNLPIWSGAPNPVSTGEDLYVAASEGYLGALPGSAFGVEAIALGCYPDSGHEEDYLLRFFPGGKPWDPGILVPMGQTLGWTLAKQPVVVRNLKAYTMDVFDGPSPFAYWVTPAPIK
jgi:hypothetical protein